MRPRAQTCLAQCFPWRRLMSLSAGSTKDNGIVRQSVGKAWRHPRPADGARCADAKPMSMPRCARCAARCSRPTSRSTWCATSPISVREQAVGATVVKSVTPGQMVVKIVHDELVATLGADGQTIDLNAVPPVADHDGRPAGLRQNHHHRETRPPPDPARQAQGADGLARHLPPGGDGAARGARARPRHPDAADRRRPEAGPDRQARAGSRQSSAATTSCCSTPPAAPRSTKR